MSRVQIERDDLQALSVLARRTLGEGHPLVQACSRALHPAAVVIELRPNLMSADAIEATFKKFYAAYPIRKAPAAARKAWAKAVAKAPADTIIEAAAAYAAYIQRTGEYAAHPATWLNNDRWEDDLTTGARTDRSTANRAALVQGGANMEAGLTFKQRMALASQPALGS